MKTMVNGGNAGDATNMTHSERVINDFGDIFGGKENYELYPADAKKRYNMTDEEEKDFLEYQKKTTDIIIKAGLGTMNFGGFNYNLEKTSEFQIPATVLKEKRNRQRNIEVAKIHNSGGLYNVLYLEYWKRVYR